MHTQSITQTMAPRNGVLVLTGYGLTVNVERGHLHCTDGRGNERRSGRFPRAPRPFKRLVIVGHSGALSLEALRWLHDVGVSLVVLSRDGVVLSHGPAGLDDARLRRAQALALSNGTGLAIVRTLLRAKLAGQASVLATLPDVAGSEHVRALIPSLDSAQTMDALRVIEAAAAARYWLAWECLPVRFTQRDARLVPAHWLTFGQRSSLVANGPRRATNPANAMLNYLYAILEADASLAALAVGLDPGIGFLHVDVRSRASLACDLMEAVRPSVDAFVLSLLQSQPFRRDDFFENTDGVCRVTVRLTPTLSETADRWARLIAPVAEHVAQALYDGRHAATTPARNAVLPTPLTQTHRRSGRRKPMSDSAAAVSDSIAAASERAPARLFPVCQDCGARLARSDRRYCDDCLPERKAEVTATFVAAGPRALAALRTLGTDPAHTVAANRQRGVRNAEHRLAAEHWDHSTGAPADREAFRRDILPMLQSLPLSRLMQATGLSLRYCALIRRGDCIPHARHWPALQAIGTS